jgi:hypothetical protein
MYSKKSKVEIKSTKKTTRQGQSSLSKPRHNKKISRGQGK